jgi:hypothetical protein
MGLDMYLERIPKDLTPEEISSLQFYKYYLQYKQSNPNVTLRKFGGRSARKPSKEILKKYKDIDVCEDIGYWRKANAVHDWFDRNLGGLEDCERKEVSKELLEKLLSDCEKVLGKSKLVKGKVQNGTTYIDNEWVPNMEDGQVIEDPSCAQELIPTADGFLFGGTDYDEYYVDKLEQTVEIVENALATTDFNKYRIMYHGWW